MSDSDRLAYSRRNERMILAGSVIAAIIVLTIIGIALAQYREEILARAQLLGRSQMLSLETQVSQKLQGYDAALDLVVADWRTDSVAPQALWQRILTTLAEDAGHVTSIQVFDAEGRLLAASDLSSPMPQSSGLLDWHRADRSPGVHLLGPQQGGKETGGWTFTLSRRRSGAEGAFDGIVVIMVKLEFLSAILDRMAIGPGDTLVVVDDHGTVLMRRPAIDGFGDTGLDVSRSVNFLRIAGTETGSFTAVASLDHVERLYSYARIPGTGLIVSVGLATGPIFSAWRWRSLAIGGVAVAISLALIAFAVLLRRELRLRTAAERELEQLAMTDFLTGLANRRRFDEIIQREWRRATRTGRPLSLLLLDADHFKQINDRFGHGVGDEVLKMLAGVLAGYARRPGDTAARIGGEEFAMVLPDTPLQGALFVAEQIRALVASGVQPGIPAVTVSIGAATTEGPSAQSAASLVQSADAAVYAAKQHGRDRVHQAAT